MITTKQLREEHTELTLLYKQMLAELKAIKKELKDIKDLVKERTYNIIDNNLVEYRSE